MITCGSEGGLILVYEALFEAFIDSISTYNCSGLTILGSIAAVSDYLWL